MVDVAYVANAAVTDNAAAVVVGIVSYAVVDAVERIAVVAGSFAVAFEIVAVVLWAVIVKSIVVDSMNIVVADVNWIVAIVAGVNELVVLVFVVEDVVDGVVVVVFVLDLFEVDVTGTVGVD